MDLADAQHHYFGMRHPAMYPPIVMADWLRSDPSVISRKFIPG
jgi:hypothetical protein